MTPPPSFPRVRWAALGWLAVWATAYAQVWGWVNFLFLCDISVILTCLGLWRSSALLLSSQAVSSLIVETLWCIDFGWRLLLGRQLIGATEYMWDARYPLAVRLLSLFHVMLPLLLVWAVRRVGYDGRAFRTQAAIAVVAVIGARFVRSDLNINFAHRDPIWKRSFGPAPVHLGVILAGLLGVLYWPTHLALARWMPSARAARERRSA